MSQDLRGQRAVVVGGGFGGMCAAAMLSQLGASVTVLDRRGGDPPASGWQGRFLHVLLAGGQGLLARWFDGIDARLAAAGAPLQDWGRDAAVFHLGGWMPRYASGLVARGCTRPLLERTLRDVLRARPGVVWRGGVDVRALLRLGAWVTGVQTDGGVLPADLLVLAPGRGPGALGLLRSLGCGSPKRTRVHAPARYVTWTVSPPAATQPWRTLYLMHQGRKLPRSGLIYPVEGGRWQVNLVSYEGPAPPKDWAQAVDWARSLAVPDLAQALAGCTPSGPPALAQVGQNEWRRFSGQPAWPANLAVLGDAAAAFNPVYGQGMTAAAQGVRTLEACVRAGTLAGFQMLLERQQRPLWWMTSCEDMRWSGSRGPGGPWTAAMRLAFQGLHRTARHSRILYRALAEVMQMAKPAQHLLQPWRWGGAMVDPGSAAAWAG